MTLEELQAKVLEQEETIKTQKAELLIATDQVKEKETKINDLQLHNQKLFLKLTDNVVEEEEKEKEIVSCEDFAKTLNI